MKCFECKKEINNELLMKHIGDGDFIHESCSENFEKNRKEFFGNIGDEKWYNRWIENSQVAEW